MEENRGEAAKLPADPSSISVEANDAKTGVHCPQLRARKERMRKREREKDKKRKKEKDCLAKRVAERNEEYFCVSSQ